ncbi:MAG: hypothetical protein IJ079_10970 [Lachnospiraceae bacterium]|nr:hypothetical protein [Lachnospiraceae bacterium]
MRYPFIIIFALLCLVLMHRLRYVKKKEKEGSDQFWAREAKADQVRKQDISDLDYIYIPIELLPFGVDHTPDVTELEDTLRRLDNTKILNLNQYTNTDLKLQYGAANLPFLSECDDRYTTLVRTLYQWACLLMDHGHIEEAVTVAKYCIDIDADLSGIYYMLTDYYNLENDVSALQDLMQHADNLTGITSGQIRNYIQEALDHSQDQ